MQELWEKEKPFEIDAPADMKEPHFMATFPYPYMNGMLHLGHAFTATKAEFATRYHALKGDNAIFPFGFHCTGMPIQAAANKLKHEIETYGCPPVFPEEVPEEKATSTGEQAKEAVPGEFHGKKTKLVAKTGGSKVHQWTILEKQGIPAEEIPKFVDPEHWLRFFPPLGMADLKKFGLCSDFRRSFITTSVNPYYNNFVRWQFLKLKAAGRVKFGKRPSIFSPLDGQICADHDRASGEGVIPQCYTCIKIQMLELPEAMKSLAEKKVFLVAATLRPETMYGQTNCFVLPGATYGVFEMKNGEVYVCSDRSARNMAYQGLFAEDGKVNKLMEVSGDDLLGKAIKAPNCTYDKVYTLPLLTISMTKGTGIVTCVPSDAPTDFAALRDLKEKPKLREKYHITDEMVLPYDVVEIIEVPGLGKRLAEKACLDMGIKSQNDTQKLEEAKELVYKKGFYEGVMLVGSQAGKRVEEAKPIVQQEMIDAGKAFLYYEPNGLVISRSGDECVVTFSDQWYLTYGEKDWQPLIRDYIHNKLETYNPKTKQALENSCDWLSSWACSRQFGLGTRLPWDPQFLIESLSDSTIYMAYYTIAHLLQGDLFGEKVGPLGIKAELLTPEVFDYIYCEGAYPEGCGIEREKLDKLKHEFEYWYPYDLRVSGKDLIKNHLMMSLYNHQAIWPDMSKMPRSYFCNGHIQLNNEKMSKSTGNFLTVDDAIKQFGADATRFACADAGDGLDDANFAVATANAAILSLTTEEEFIRSVVSGELATSERPEAEYHFFDKNFQNEMSDCVLRCDQAYKEMRFRDALQIGFYEMQGIRNAYRDACAKMGVAMEKPLLLRFTELEVLMLAPIVPHFADNVWRTLLHRTNSIWKGTWPAVQPTDAVLSRSYDFFNKNERNLRETVNKKPKKVPANWHRPNKVFIYCAREYHPWQQFALRILQENYDAATKTLPANIIALVKEKVGASEEYKKQMKDILAFVSFTVKTDFPQMGEDAFALEMPFDEKQVMESCATFIKKDCQLDDVQVFHAEDDSISFPRHVGILHSHVPDPMNRKKEAKPGKPAYCAYYEEYGCLLQTRLVVMVAPVVPLVGGVTPRPVRIPFEDVQQLPVHLLCISVADRNCVHHMHRIGNGVCDLLLIASHRAHHQLCAFHVLPRVRRLGIDVESRFKAGDALLVLPELHQSLGLPPNPLPTQRRALYKRRQTLERARSPRCSSAGLH